MWRCPCTQLLEPWTRNCLQCLHLGHRLPLIRQHLLEQNPQSSCQREERQVQDCIPQLMPGFHPSCLLCQWHGLKRCANGRATHCLAACEEVEPHIRGHGKLHPHKDEPCHCPVQHPPPLGQPNQPTLPTGPHGWHCSHLQESTTKQISNNNATAHSGTPIPYNFQHTSTTIAIPHTNYNTANDTPHQLPMTPPLTMDYNTDNTPDSLHQQTLWHLLAAPPHCRETSHLFMPLCSDSQ
ncbi:hypothetical protein ACHAW6_002592 [Cyclotella cf. meneghiniana]